MGTKCALTLTIRRPPEIVHVNKVSAVFTLSHVAEMLGENEYWLCDVASEMDTEDGQLWVVTASTVAPTKFARVLR